MRASSAHAASGRNGGFFLSSLTHGIDNGLARFGDQMATLERLGLENFDSVVATIERHGIDCDLELTGNLDVAVEPHEVAGFADQVETLRAHGHEAELLDREQVRAEVDSPIYAAGCWQRSGAGLLDPAKLCWGLAAAARALGVRIHERTEVTRLRNNGATVELTHFHRRRSGPPGAARDQRLSGAGADDPAPDRPGLRLRPRHRAALAGAA